MFFDLYSFLCLLRVMSFPVMLCSLQKWHEVRKVYTFSFSNLSHIVSYSFFLYISIYVITPSALRWHQHKRGISCLYWRTFRAHSYFKVALSYFPLRTASQTRPGWFSRPYIWTHKTLANRYQATLILARVLELQEYISIELLWMPNCINATWGTFSPFLGVDIPSKLKSNIWMFSLLHNQGEGNAWTYTLFDYMD